MAAVTDLVSLDFDLGRGHARLIKLRDLFNNTAELARGVLRVANDVVNGDTVTIGTDVFVVDIVNSNPAAGAATAAALANTSDDSVVTTSVAHGLIVGDLIKVENEIMRVKAVRSTTVVYVARGASGTSVASHAAASTVKVSDAPGVDVTAGRIPVGLVTTLTPTVFLAALVDDINTASAQAIGTDANVRKCAAIKDGNNTMYLIAQKRGVLALATTETLTDASNVWDAAVMSGGKNPSIRRMLSVARVPIAAEVTAGKLVIPVDFTPVSIQVRVVVTSTGAEKTSTGAEWDGAITITAPTGIQPGLVTLDNTGSVDWAATDTVHVLISE